MSGPGFIAPEPDRRCELCGKTAETRPYGPGGCRICFECGQKDREGTERRMEAYIMPNTVEGPRLPSIRINGEVVATAPDPEWTSRQDAWPPTRRWVEVCWSNKNLEKQTYVYGVARVLNYQANGTSEWQHRKGDMCLFNPDFWRL